MGVKRHDEMLKKLQGAFDGENLEVELGNYVVKVGKDYYWKNANTNRATSSKVSRRFQEVFDEMEPVIENGSASKTKVQISRTDLDKFQGKFSPKALSNFSWAIGNYFEYLVYRELQTQSKDAQITGAGNAQKSVVWHFRVDKSHGDFIGRRSRKNPGSAYNRLRNADNGPRIIKQLETAAKDAAARYIAIIQATAKEIQGVVNATVINVGGNDSLGDLKITVNGTDFHKDFVLELKAYQKDKFNYFTLNDTNFEGSFSKYLYAMSSLPENTWVNSPPGAPRVEASEWKTRALATVPPYLVSRIGKDAKPTAVLRYYLSKGKPDFGSHEAQKSIIYAGTTTEKDSIRSLIFVEDINAMIQDINGSYYPGRIKIKNDLEGGGIIFTITRGNKEQRLGEVYIADESVQKLNTISTTMSPVNNKDDDAYWITKFRMSLEAGALSDYKI